MPANSGVAVDGIEKGDSMPKRSIEQVLTDNTDQWLAIPGVEGMGIGLFEGKPCIRIFVSSNEKDLRDKIPSNIDGYTVVIEETGEFRALEQD